MRSPKPAERESEQNSRFKSILKKTSQTFSDSESGPEKCPSPSPRGGSQFYLPMPNTTRKKVQFLVESEPESPTEEIPPCEEGDDDVFVYETPAPEPSKPIVDKNATGKNKI